MEVFISSLLGIEGVWIKIILTLMVLVGLIIVRLVVVRLIHSNVSKPTAHYQWQKVLEYATIIIGFVMIAQLWAENAGKIGNYLALFTAVIAIALQGLITNLAGWVYIVWRHPFKIGDRVEVGAFAGDVIGEGFFMFSLLEIKNWVDADQHTGRILHVPNRVVFNETVANFSADFPYIWHEQSIHLTFESDWERAKEILIKTMHVHTRTIVAAAKRDVHWAKRNLAIDFGEITPKVYSAIERSGVRLTMRYLTHIGTRRELGEAVGEDVLRALASQDDINFAYPTQRIVGMRSPENKM